MHRTRAWRRGQRQRAIAKRRRFIRTTWATSPAWQQHMLDRSPGLFAKRKVLDCSCWDCQQGARPLEFVEPFGASYYSAAIVEFLAA